MWRTSRKQASSWLCFKSICLIFQRLSAGSLSPPEKVRKKKEYISRGNLFSITPQQKYQTWTFWRSVPGNRFFSSLSRQHSLRPLLIFSGSICGRQYIAGESHMPWHGTTLRFHTFTSAPAFFATLEYRGVWSEGMGTKCINRRFIIFQASLSSAGIPRTTVHMLSSMWLRVGKTRLLASTQTFFSSQLTGPPGKVSSGSFLPTYPRPQ